MRSILNIMKTVAKYMAAGIIGGGAVLGFSEIPIRIVDRPANEDLADCQLGVELGNTLTGTCAEAVIDISMRADEIYATVHASPELEEFGSVNDPGRLALVEDSFKEELVGELQKQKKDIRGQRIGHALFGFLYGAAVFGAYRIYTNRRDSPDDPPPKSTEDLPVEEQRHLRIVA
jgi:hypothetical protein